MNVWQASVAMGLIASSAGSLAFWSRARRQYRNAFRTATPPAAIRFGWVAAVAPVVEAWMLWMGGFFSHGC